MCHTENTYGDKHKKQPDARKLLEYPILLVVACSANGSSPFHKLATCGKPRLLGEQKFAVPCYGYNWLRGGVAASATYNT